MWRHYFPSTKWDIFSSQENDEQEILEMLEDRLLQQIINFPTCGTNTMDVFLYQNCQVYSEHDENFDKIYDCSDHITIRTAIELEHFDPPPAMTIFYSFVSGDYDRIVGAMKDRPFNPQCYTNVQRNSGLLNRLDRHSHPKKNQISSIATTLDYTEYITSDENSQHAKEVTQKTTS